MSKDKPSNLSDAQFADILEPFGVHPSVDQIHKIRDYVSLLLRWNKSISLTTVIDPVEIVSRHFGESMFAKSLLPVENCRLADVGSGAGFPGLPLKIISESLKVTLVESNKKKCAFLSEVSRSLGFTGVDILPQRFEEARVESGFANIVTSRAVGDFAALLRWSRNALPERGHIVLWVGGEDATAIASTPGWIWHPPVRIPESQRRFILIGRPSSQTPKF